MISDLDIYRSAQVLVKRHGQDAPIHAAMRADRDHQAVVLAGADCRAAQRTAPCCRQGDFPH